MKAMSRRAGASPQTTKTAGGTWKTSRPSTQPSVPCVRSTVDVETPQVGSSRVGSLGEKDSLIRALRHPSAPHRVPCSGSSSPTTEPARSPSSTTILSRGRKCLDDGPMPSKPAAHAFQHRLAYRCPASCDAAAAPLDGAVAVFVRVAIDPRVRSDLSDKVAALNV